MNCAAIVYESYNCGSEEPIKKITAKYAEMADIPWFQIDQMKKLVFRKSGIYHNIKKIIRCRNCNQWSLTNHVFCPKCCRNPSSVTNWELCRLYMCGSKNCCSTTPIEGNSDPLFFEQLICAHKTRKPCGDYVLYVPIESVIVDYIQCGYLGEMIGLREEEIVLLAKNAPVCGFHHQLLSQNALDVYHNLGFQNAEAAVKAYLQSCEVHDSMTCLQSLVDTINLPPDSTDRLTPTQARNPPLRDSSYDQVSHVIVFHCRIVTIRVETVAMIIMPITRSIVSETVIWKH